jgi:hypothetical protein
MHTTDTQGGETSTKEKKKHASTEPSLAQVRDRTQARACLFLLFCHYFVYLSAPALVHHPGACTHTHTHTHTHTLHHASTTITRSVAFSCPPVRGVYIWCFLLYIRYRFLYIRSLTRRGGLAGVVCRFCFFACGVGPPDTHVSIQHARLAICRNSGHIQYQGG